MPVMDGIEATEIIRKNDSVTPIIALTAVNLDDKDEKFFQSRVYRYYSQTL